MSERATSARDAIAGVSGAWTAPVVVGRYLADAEARFHPLAESEVQRIARFYGRVLATYDLPARSHVLVTSLASQVGAVMPLERALADRHLILSNSDATTFDAGRLAMYVRRFGVRAVFGVTGAVLDGLEALDIDADALLAGRIVWATPEACARMTPVGGTVLRQWVELGPAVGAECVHGGGVHVCSEEWHCRDGDGELHLTSQRRKLVPFDDHATGVAIRGLHRVCPCGGSDLRVELA